MGCVWVFMEKVKLRYWWEYSDKKTMNKLVERKVSTETVVLRFGTCLELEGKT